ncbi:MAG: hypothetical protein FJY88_11295 [Candidatus Eisenbacteria bacterium]|nr:hypothetical protein [Candidatus Eisenbacteria bacterium]
MGLVRQSATTFASRILITIVNIPISILVARSLGVEGQGVYAAAGAFPALWATFWILGLDASHTWSLAGGRTSLGRVLGNTAVWLILLSLLAVPTYMLAIRLLDPEKARALVPVLWITALMIPLLLARTLLLSCFLGMHQVDQYNLLNVVSQIVLLVLLVIALMLGRGGTRAAVAALAFANALLVAIAIAWVIRRKPPDDPVRTDRALMKTSFSYGVRGYGATLFGQLNYRFDQVLVTHFAGVAEQGYYSIAVLLAEKLAHITNSVQLVVFPRVSASTTEDANRITTTACRHAVFWVGMAALAMYALGRVLIRLLYGSAFLPALSALFYLIPGIFLLSYWKVLAVDLSGRNRRFPTTLASFIALGVNTLLNFHWIPRHGMVGAAWSSTISYAVQSFVLILFFLRITGIPARKLFIPERGDLEIYRRLIAGLGKGRKGK